MHGEEIIFEGKPIQEQSAAVKGLIDSFNAKEQIKKRCVQEIHNTAIERCTQASDIANVRGGAFVAGPRARKKIEKIEGRAG